MEQLKFKYESISKWIENADTKAQILIGIQLFIVGYIFEQVFPLSYCDWFELFSLLIFAFISCTSLFYLYRIIKPRLSNNNYNSRIYFRDIAMTAAIDEERLKEDLASEKEEDFSKDLANQVIALSKVCNDKYQDLKNAEDYMVASFILGLILAFIIF